MTKKTHEDYISELKIKNPNIEVLGYYEGCKTKMKFKCNIDNYEWTALAYSVLSRGRCPKCSVNEKIIKRTKTHSKFIEEIGNINPNIEVLSKYKGDKNKVKCKCKIDGNEFEMIANNILRGQGCPECGLKSRALKRTKSHEIFVGEVFEINPNIKILEKYTHSGIKIKVQCKIDGHIWNVRPSDLIKGRGCPKCGKRSMKSKTTLSDDIFKEKLLKINPDINVIGQYKNSKSYIKCECKIDGHIWNVRPNNLLRGSRCPKCANKSKGEIAIRKFCIDNFISYQEQYTFGDCKQKRKLRYDFALFNQDSCVAVLEYQGQQHYSAIDFAGKGEEWANEEFKRTQKRDQIKRDYCLNNNIPLIEIPYWIEDVDNYLEEKLNEIINKPLQLSLV